MAPPTFPPGISVHITVFIDPSNVEKFMQNLLEVFHGVTALPECTLFEVFQSPEDPGEISWVENWTVPVETVLAHVQQDIYKKNFEVAESMFLKPKVMKVFNRLGEQYTATRKTNGGFRE